MNTQMFHLGDEYGRIRALNSLHARTHSSEARFYNITRVLQIILDMEMVVISLIAENKQILKAQQGTDVAESPRNEAFCNIAIQDYEPLIIEDTHDDPRVRDLPSVTKPPFLRCYIGAPLTTPEGYNLGTICAFGTEPRRFTAREVIIVKSFAELVMAQLELGGQANRDYLTQVGNRRSFMAGLEKEMERLRRNKNAASVAFLDIDFFKRVNDRFGHAVGDRVLREFADVVVAQSRQNDFVARLGGEEFGVLLPDTDLDAARIWAERLRLRVAETRFDGDTALSLTVSVGLTEIDATGMTAEAIMHLADSALYDAKKLGRDRVVVL